MHNVSPSVMVYLTCVIIGVGGQGEIKHGLKQQHSIVCFYMLMSDLTPGSSTYESFAASEENWHPHCYCYY